MTYYSRSPDFAVSFASPVPTAELKTYCTFLRMAESMPGPHLNNLFCRSGASSLTFSLLFSTLFPSCFNGILYLDFATLCSLCPCPLYSRCPASRLCPLVPFSTSSITLQSFTSLVSKFSHRASAIQRNVNLFLCAPELYRRLTRRSRTQLS